MVQTSNELEFELSASAAAKKTHPEDLCVGDDVAVAEQVLQFPSYCWDECNSMFESKEQPVRISFQSLDPFEAYKVTALCLPFVMVTNRQEKAKVFDLRLTRLFRLSASFAESFRKQKKKKVKAKSKKKRKKR